MDSPWMSLRLIRVGWSRLTACVQVHRHWRTSEVIETPLPNPLPIKSHQMARFYRVHLHQLLVSHIPPERIHLNKRVANVRPCQAEARSGERTHGVIVDFEDGTRWEGDAVVGADGIRSRTRSCFYPDYEVSAGELVTLRQVFAASKLEGLDRIPKESCHWPGPDRQLFTSPLSGSRSSPPSRTRCAMSVCDFTDDT